MLIYRSEIVNDFRTHVDCLRTLMDKVCRDRSPNCGIEVNQRPARLTFAAVRHFIIGVGFV